MTEVYQADTKVAEEISRLATLSRQMFGLLNEFTQQHGPALLQDRPLRVEAATELVCIVSNCRRITEGLRDLCSRLPSVPESEPE